MNCKVNIIYGDTKNGAQSHDSILMGFGIEMSSVVDSQAPQRDCRYTAHAGGMA